ncbi:MAG TPA: MMPL family transporter, partial [Acidimicrobiales bacterium]|nr:MMPL family transporter [Acidimicrobiales bacterium]
MFTRLGTWCHDRRRLVLGLWLAVLVLGGAVSGAVGGAFRDEFNLPDVESRRGFDILDDAFGGQGTGQVGTIVFRADQGVDDPEVRADMEALFDSVAGIDDVMRVESPYADGGEDRIASEGPEAGKIAFANIEMPEDIEFARAGEIRDEILANAPEIDGLDIELGGFIFAEFDEPSSEVLGLAFAIVILIVAFGSVLAMGLPVGVALFGIGLGSVLITLLSNVLTIPDFATFLGLMIGLGVGIDYALLIVTRYREQLHAGHTVRESVAIAMDTAGRSVLFAGTTVVISLLGMLLMGVSFVQGLAVGAAAVVAVTVVASLTLLPALIGFAGARVELTRWRGLIAAALAAVALVGIGLDITPLTVGLPLAAIVLIAGFFVGPLKREVPRRAARPLRETTAYRWSRVIQHHPWIAALAGAVGLVVLAIPVLGLRLGFSDESNYADDTTTKQAYDLLVDGFGPGFNGPLILATELPAGTDLDGLSAITDAVAADPGVAFLSEPRPDDPDDPTAAVWQLVPTSAPQDEATTELVDRLRDDVLPPVEADAGVDLAVTGTVAVNLDFSDYLASRLPYFFGAVLTLSFLLLMVVFRSLLVPLKAVVMNLLSIGAAYGIVVALFQWGWLSDITGVQPAPIEPWMPMMLFAIVFGLSMDYEVFLLSRMKEEYDRTHDNPTAVADGLAATARVITAAALI